MKTESLAICIFMILSLGVLAVEGCRDKAAGSKEPTALILSQPSNFPPPNDLFRDNPLTREGFELGRKLFYDNRLSRDGSTSCGSCHQQFAAFATLDHALSHGIGNQFTTRNAPGLFNLAWMKEFHWDGGIGHLEVQPLSPITAPNEMGETMEDLLRELNSDSRYREMFRAAFGDPQIGSQGLLKALSQFMGSVVSAESKYDRVMRGQASFGLAEESGYAVFRAKCANCHREPLFTDLSYRNTGMPLSSGLNDHGRMRITRLRGDSLKFRVPSLRNVMLTAPYGHDGRFATVSAVIEHYRSGINDGPTLDPVLKNRISISNNERADLIQFLHTLTDTTFTKDKRFSDPG